jgi:hypothetical protein
MKLVRYKYRHECLEDSLQFFVLAGQTNRVGALCGVEIIPTTLGADYLPDGEVAFSTTLAEAEIAVLLDGVPDSHVIAQTIERVENYTGERKDRERAFGITA